MTDHENEITGLKSYPLTRDPSKVFAHDRGGNGILDGFAPNLQRLEAILSEDKLDGIADDIKALVYEDHMILAEALAQLINMESVTGDLIAKHLHKWASDRLNKKQV